MTGHILIIEDIAELAELYKVYLEKEGLTVSCLTSAEAGLVWLQEKKPLDLLILDINLPGMDGFQFLERFRKQHELPVMILSARASDEDIIQGLGTGADDYVPKPCPPKVLVARARAHLRRNDRSPDPQDSTIQFGPYCLNRAAMLLKRDQVVVSLSPREFGILFCLIDAEGRPLSPETIYSSVWDQAWGDASAVGVYIQRLRRKLDDQSESPRFIQTVHGLGYRFNPDFIHPGHGQSQ